MDIFGGGAFLLNSTLQMSSKGSSSSGWIVNSGESHLFLLSGGSYLMTKASKTSFEYLSSSGLSSFQHRANSALVSQCSVHCVVLVAFDIQYSSYLYPVIKVS